MKNATKKKVDQSGIKQLALLSQVVMTSSSPLKVPGTSQGALLTCFYESRKAAWQVRWMYDENN